MYKYLESSRSYRIVILYIPIHLHQMNYSIKRIYNLSLDKQLKSSDTRGRHREYSRKSTRANPWHVQAPLPMLFASTTVNLRVN